MEAVNVMKLYSELFCTYSMEEKNRVIHILEEHQIPYKISTNGNTGISAAGEWR